MRGAGRDDPHALSVGQPARDASAQRPRRDRARPRARSPVLLQLAAQGGVGLDQQATRGGPPSSAARSISTVRSSRRRLLADRARGLGVGQQERLRLQRQPVLGAPGGGGLAQLGSPCGWASASTASGSSTTNTTSSAADTRQADPSPRGTRAPPTRCRRSSRRSRPAPPAGAPSTTARPPRRRGQQHRAPRVRALGADRLAHRVNVHRSGWRAACAGWPRRTGGSTRPRRRTARCARGAGRPAGTDRPRRRAPRTCPRPRPPARARSRRAARCRATWSRDRSARRGSWRNGRRRPRAGTRAGSAPGRTSPARPARARAPAGTAPPSAPAARGDRAAPRRRATSRARAGQHRRRGQRIVAGAALARKNSRSAQARLGQLVVADDVKERARPGHPGEGGPHGRAERAVRPIELDRRGAVGEGADLAQRLREAAALGGDQHVEIRPGCDH